MPTFRATVTRDDSEVPSVPHTVRVLADTQQEARRRLEDAGLVILALWVIEPPPESPPA